MASRVDWLEDIAVLLQDLGIGEVWDGSVAAGIFAIMLDKRAKKRQHTIIQLIRSGGSPDPDLVEVRKPGFQVLVIVNKRSVQPGIAKGRAVYDALHNRISLSPTGSDRVFAWFQAQQEPSHVGEDDNGNFLYSHNYLTEFREGVT